MEPSLVAGRFWTGQLARAQNRNRLVGGRLRLQSEPITSTPKVAATAVFYSQPAFDVQLNHGKM